jgi:hypothetical protein
VSTDREEVRMNMGKRSLPPWEAWLKDAVK